MNEKIIVYEHVTNGSLDKYLKDANLTWMRRLKICIDVASALDFLHGGAAALKRVVHTDIKSQSILLNNDWKAKLFNLELFSLGSLQQDMEHVTDNAYDTYGYLDPQYKQGSLTEKTDIYSFGMVLFEILCGRLASVEDENGSLGTLVKKYFRQGKLDEIVFEGIKEQIVPESLTTFANVAYQCLNDSGYERPDASEVVIQLEKALEFQEDYEIWEPKLPRGYKEIIRLLETPAIYYTQKKKEFYKKLSRGIFLQKEKVWLILSGSGKTHKMISATMFSYENRESHKWRSIHKSRFGTVAKMLDISNLKIQITVNTQFLSPGVFYRVNLVFKFCEPRKYSSKPMYVNLKYRNWSRPLHSLFATWRDDGWMMIELYRFLHHKEDFDFDILLESLSRYYCRSDAIYIEGIEFQAIANVAHEDIDNEEEGQHIVKPISNTNQVRQLLANFEEISLSSESDDDDDDDDDDEKFQVSEVNGKKHLMLLAAKVLYNSSKLKTFRYKASANYSRSQALVELLPQQVFRIKYKIKGQMLSPFTEYACYLVFELSEKCRGLHCPVKVRDLLHRRSKETKIIYFRSPTPLNRHDSFWTPNQREDGWMEVMVWKFNSKYKLGKDIIPMNLKLIAYEGTMSGLIIGGLEFRPV